MAVSDRGAQQLVEFSRASHLTAPDDLPLLMLSTPEAWAHDAALYLVDYEQRILVPVPIAGERVRDEVIIDTTRPTPFQSARRLGF